MKSEKVKVKKRVRNEGRPGYKKTRVGWIPEEWEGRYLLQTGCKVIDGDRGKEYPKQHEFGLAGHCLFLNAGNVTKEGFCFLDCHFITKEKDSKLRKGKLKRGDIVITTRGTVGSFALYNEKIEFDHIRINSGMAIIRTRTNNTNILHTFLYTLLRSHVIENQIKRIVFGSAQPQLTIHLINRFYLSLPPLPEQTKIAEILSAWDRAIEQVGKLIDAKQRLKKGLMQRLFTGRMRFPEFNHEIHEIHERKKGELPEGWKNKTLGSFGLFSKGKGISNSEKKETGFPCITYGEIYTRHEFIIKEFHSFIDKDTAQKSQRIQKGDIIFAGSGETLDEIGKCVVYTQDEEAYAGGDIIIFRPKGVDSVYLSYLLNSDLLIRQKRKLGQGYSVVHIYSSGLKILHVPLPSLPEQTRIAAAISTCDREIELLRRKEIALREQKKGLMQKLLTGEVRHPKFLKEGRA